MTGRPPGYAGDKEDLLNRLRRIRGQVGGIASAMTRAGGCCG